MILTDSRLKPLLDGLDLSMPLFHSNAIMSGFSPAYILDTPPWYDDAEITVRAGFGNEAAPGDIPGSAKRFGCTVKDGYGSTKLAIVIVRTEHSPQESIGGSVCWSCPSPPRPTSRPRRGRAGAGLPTSCPPRRPTRSSSAS